MKWKRIIVTLRKELYVNCKTNKLDTSQKFAGFLENEREFSLGRATFFVTELVCTLHNSRKFHYVMLQYFPCYCCYVPFLFRGNINWAFPYIFVCIYIWYLFKAIHNKQGTSTKRLNKITDTWILVSRRKYKLQFVLLLKLFICISIFVSQKRSNLQL